jgi:hypothetical protein
MVKVYLVDGMTGKKGTIRTPIDIPRIPVPGELFHFYGGQPELDSSLRVKTVIYNVNTYVSPAKRIIKKEGSGSKLEVIVVLEPTTESDRDAILSAL